MITGKKVVMNWVDRNHRYGLFAWRRHRLVDSRAEGFTLERASAISQDSRWPEAASLCPGLADLVSTFVPSSGDALRILGWPLAVLLFVTMPCLTYELLICDKMDFYLVLAHQNNVTHVSASMVRYKRLDTIHLKTRLLVYIFPAGQFSILPVGRNFPHMLSKELFVGRGHRPLASPA